MLLKFMALMISIVPMVSSQRNVLHQKDSGDAQSVIVTARTRAFLSCESGDIVVKVNFTQPFRGLMYAHRSRSSPCRVHGTGGNYYTLRIPLKGCGTWQESPRVFVNNITIRFHPALELEEDETKTVVCRYPPPLTPPPGSIHIIEPPTAGPIPVSTRVGTARLSEVEILIIICLLLFLSLLTLGIGIAYFCLKRRNIHIVRKSATASSAPPSQITRLSSTNIPPASSLLSSVLGHTVRIPRAIPYSAPAVRTPIVSSPDHQYEEYPGSTSTASGELSETSVSSSSEDQADASRQLLYKKAGVRTLLSIPKAILRKSGIKKGEFGANVHNYHPKVNTSSVGTSVRRPEMEDQTIITVLDHEGPMDEEDKATKYSILQSAKKTSEQTADKNSGLQSKFTPVYAQVDKNKKSTKTQGLNIEKLSMFQPDTKRKPKIPIRPSPVVGAARRQRSVITDIPEESTTSEEVTKNTTVTTSVRREVTETRILSPILRKGEVLDETTDLSTSEAGSRTSPTDNTAVPYTEQAMAQHQPPKAILIRDVADIYLTTTVETESHEMKTTVSRDILEEHAKADADETKSPTSDLNAVAKSDIGARSPTDNWNVVIRTRKPPPGFQIASAENTENGNKVEDIQNPKVEIMPVFNVKIRAISPEELKQKESARVASIPPLEMPQTVSKIKEALMSKALENLPATKLPDRNFNNTSDKNAFDNKEKINLQSRTVRWMDNSKSISQDKDSSVSSSDSFQSAESLRERSSSEVLEVAPTLPSQRKSSGHPMLERSTSEIVTSPEEHVRWIGGVVPVLESLSPEFLANIPVVIQGGFFNQQRTPSPKNDKN